jgi:malate dehydrogenase (oxaloacetate-decarboxylating)
VAISTSIILRIEIESDRISFGEVTALINQMGGDVVAIDVISSGKSRSTRDITINVSEQIYDSLLAAVQQLNGVHLHQLKTPIKN